MVRIVIGGIYEDTDGCQWSVSHADAANGDTFALHRIAAPQGALTAPYTMRWFYSNGLPFQTGSDARRLVRQVNLGKTDMQRLCDLLRSFGLHPEPKPAGKVQGAIHDPQNRGRRFEIEITGEDPSGKVTGYSGFVTCFYFDEDEKFVEMGAWE